MYTSTRIYKLYTYTVIRLVTYVHNYLHACIYQNELWADQFDLVWMTFLCAVASLVAHGQAHTHNTTTHNARAHTHTLSLSHKIGMWTAQGLAAAWSFMTLCGISTSPEGNWNEQKLCSFALFVWQICSCFYFLLLSLHRTDVPQTPWLQRKQRSNLDSVDCDRFSPSHHDLLHHVKPFPRMWLFFVVATPLSSSLEVNSMVHAECLVI